MMEVREYLKNKNLLFDGAMGTYFALKTKREAKLCEEANFDMPDVIGEIHAEYIASGACAIRTNTFSASDMDENKARMCIKQACRIAKKAAEGREVFIFADMGPVEKSENAAKYYSFASDVFIEEGIKNFVFETLPDNTGIFEAAEYIKNSVPDSFVIASYAVSPSGYTNTGRHYMSLLDEAEKNIFIDAAGMNCVSGPLHLEKLAGKVNLKKPLSIMPNAGYPTVLGSRTVYGKSETYFANIMCQIAASGAGILGGCCGTTPRFTAECEKNGISHIKSAKKDKPYSKSRSVRAADNLFAEKLAAGKRVIAVELDPPEDMDTEFFTSGAVKLKKAGADIITIADCPVARPRMDSSILACKLKREFGIDALPHMACRDRNLNAMKALILGLNAEGVNNILAVTGDPIPTDKRDEVKSVFNFNSRMLIKFISSLNENELISPVNICAALNINAINFGVQLKLAKEKADNGAKVFLTQPLMTKSALENLKTARRELNAKLLCGIMPIVSYKNALYMQSEIAGITIDSNLISMFEGKTRAEAEEIGKRAALFEARAANDYCDGFYIITPFKRINLSAAITGEIIREMF